MKKNWLRGLLLGVSMALLLFPTLTYAQDDPPDKAAASEGPSICQIAPQPEGGPDSYGYIWDEVPISWIDISTSGTDVTNLVLEALCTQVGIGFNFYFYGGLKTQVSICADGYLTFPATANSDWTVDCGDPDGVVNANAPNDAIYPFWTDLDAQPGSGGFGGGNVYYETLGTAPNRRFVVEFEDVQYWFSSDEVTFEVILYEGSNDILVQFETVPSPPYSGPNGAGIGIENSTGTDGLTYACNDSSLADDDLAILFRYNFDLGNQVWYDTNQNGIQDAGEPGVAAMTIDLFPTSDCTGSADASGITDGNGFYLFPDLIAGDYCLEFSNIPVGWVITPPDQGADGVDSDVNPKTRQITGISLVDEDDLDEDMGLYEPHVEFVPEWGSIALLGSGLMGLAGYATLRCRARE